MKLKEEEMPINANAFNQAYGEGRVREFLQRNNNLGFSLDEIATALNTSLTDTAGWLAGAVGDGSVLVGVTKTGGPIGAFYMARSSLRAPCNKQGPETGP